MRISNEEFIQKANVIHNNKYHYSFNELGKLQIVCKIHGAFKQRKDYHLKGGGCKKCACILNAKNKIKIAKESLSIVGNKLHNNKYDYSKSIYINNKTKIIISCPIHGHFEQTPLRHLILKQGCPQCGIHKMKCSKTKNNEEFICLAKMIHSNKYDYSKVSYKKNNIKVIIICSIHGEFLQNPEHHLKGSNCPRCARKSSSKLEDEWISLFNINNEYRQYKINIDDKKYKVDGYDPITNTVYEFYGDYWHGNPKKYHHDDINAIAHKTYGELHSQTIEKELHLKSHGYKLITIWESDFLSQRNKL
jgi:hypothetical protein